MKKKQMRMLLVTGILAAALTACGSPEKSSAPAVSAGTDTGLNAESKPTTQYTIVANQQVYALLDFADTTELENANRGFLAAPDTLDLRDEEGRAVWTQDAYAFLDKDAPDTANPSLWRNAQLNHIYGLFEVTDGIYQVRGYDIANITFVRSEHGWIVMDCGSSRYTAGEALKLFRSEMGDGRIVAVVVSHAHVDHYGGIEGLIAPEEVADRSLPRDEGLCGRGDEGKRLCRHGNEAAGVFSVWLHAALRRAGPSFGWHRTDRGAERRRLYCAELRGRRAGF